MGWGGSGKGGKGKWAWDGWMAQMAQMAMTGMPAMREGQSMVGKVKSFQAEKGFGFITCENVPFCDIYFKAADGEFEAKQTVSFLLHWTPDGKMQARDVTAAMETGQVVVGTVKSFNEKNGFGFVQVDGHSADVYFQAKDLPPELQGVQQEELPGTELQFTVHTRKDGKPQVRDAQVAASGGKKRPAAAAKTGGPAKKPRVEAPEPGDSQRDGTVKSFNSGKGWGFIVTEGVGDVFFMKKSCADQYAFRKIFPGIEVTFDLKMAPDGRPQAENVVLSGAES